MLREPFEIRGYSLANRIVAAPIASRSCELNGAPSEKTLDIYRRLADSGVGLAVAEHHAVHPWGRNRLAQLRLDSDQAAHSLIPLTQLFAERNLPLLAQINFAGNNIADESLLAQDDFRLLSASSIDKPDGNGARRPQELTSGEIEMIVESFVQAAVRAVRISGYTGVQIHACHGYLLGQFLSPLTNHREDAWGGSAKKRARLLLTVFDAVRSSVPSKAVVTVRLGAADYMPDEPMRGLSVDEVLPVARDLTAMGVDGLFISGNHCGFGGNREGDVAFFAPYARIIRECVRGATPVECTGGIQSARTANELLRGGVCDLVGVGRSLIKNPNTVKDDFLN